MFEIHTIELKKDPGGDTALADWVRLFNAESEEDMDMIGTENAGVIEAIKQVKILNLSKRLRWQYEMHKKAIRDRNARDDYVRDEGIEIGLKHGVEIGTEQGIEIGTAQGIEIGTAQGIEIGEDRKLHDQVKAKLLLGQSKEKIAEDLVESLDKVNEIIQKIRDENPEIS